MARGILTLSAAALLVGVSSQAMAGGFNRGTADTDILFEDGNFNMRSGVTVVAPQRDYDTIEANRAVFPGVQVEGTDEEYSDSYAIPSFAVKYGLGSNSACAGTYTQPFGSGATYGPQAIAAGGWADGTGTASEGFTSDEFGLTCGYNVDFSNGHKLWFLGGVFGQNFTYEQTVQFNGLVLAGGIAAQLIAAGVPAPIATAQANALGGALDGTRSTLSFDGEYEAGYRAGVAYEIPEIAFRAQFLYRSEVEHNPTGTFTTAIDPVAAPAVGFGTLPQQAELRLQSGIAAGTLAFVNVKWTDWSVLETLDYSILGGTLPGARQLEYFWRDGWTVTGGIGRQFTDSFSGLVSLTWDRGVATTEDAFFDTYTLGLGGAFTDRWGGQLRGGVAASYLKGGDVAASASPAGGPGNSFAYSVDGDMAYAAQLSYSIKW